MRKLERPIPVADCPTGGPSSRLRAALFPALVGAITTFALVGPTLDLATPLGLARTANGALVMFTAIVSFYALIAALERLIPYRSDWNRPAGDLRTDVLHLFFSGQGANALFELTLRGAAASAAVWLHARLGTSLWPAAWPALAQLFLAILVAELGHYWFHRVAHESALVWRLHATHHSAPRLYWLNATRFHPLDVFCLIACQSVPLLLLAPPPRAFLMYTLFAALYGQLQHANLDVRTRGLDRLFSTPGLHRWHHSTDPREGNTNYGAILITWDLVFGSFFRPRGRAFAGRVGIGDLPRFPTGYLAQLLSPFRWARVRAESGATAAG